MRSTNVRVGSTTFGARQPKRPSDASAAEETPQQTPEGTKTSVGTSSKGTNATPGAQQDTFLGTRYLVLCTITISDIDVVGLADVLAHRLHTYAYDR